MNARPTPARPGARYQNVTALLALLPALLAGNRGTPKPHALVVTTNVPGANIFEAGIVVGKSGEPFDTAPGPHDITVSADGYATRLVYVKIDARNPKTERAVTLLPAARKDGGDIDFAKARKIEPRAALATLPSLCAQYNASGVKMPAGLLAPCRRKTVLDDFVFFGLGDLRAAPADGTPFGALRADLTSHIGQAAKEDYYWRAEELYAGAPNDEQAILALSFSALSRGSCTRLSEIGLELDAAGLFSPGLALVRGFCLELAGEQAEAIVSFRAPVDGKRKAPANAYYFLARAAWKPSLLVAEAGLKSCRQNWASFYPCAEALAQVEALSGRQDVAVATMRAYLAGAAADVAKVAIDSRGNVSKDAVAALYAAYPWIFEAAALKMAATGAEAASLLVPLGETLVANGAGMKRLLPAFEAVRANAVLDVAYRLQLAASPNDPTLLIKLANIDRYLDKCEEALTLGGKAMKLITDSARKSALTVTMSECLTRLDRLDEAEAILDALLEAEPTIWKAQYNLGIVLQRQGKAEEAISHLEMALVSDTPPATRKRIQEMIAFLTAKKSGKPKK